ncbi:unnamed protein product [Schistosoma margrebowiei]|uniref:Uncharacterized protein n=1 Tax=Schistosoma margrebowiei TaxID=48269 RepID=A0A183LBZ0_9TREM|nr:unnamed protein product [Schistosoma margrebowiei]
MPIKTTSISAVFVSVGINIEKEKSKILKDSTENTDVITLSEETLEDVETFMYLGSVADKREGCNADTKARISKTIAAFPQLKNIWYPKYLFASQYQSENTGVKIVLPYGA